MAKNKAKSVGKAGNAKNSSKVEKTIPKKVKKTAHRKKMRLYSNLSAKHQAKKDEKSKRRAEYLATLPKDPWKRFWARLHPKRVFKWWFSWRGQKTILKVLAACILIGIIITGGLFLYYKKDIEGLRLDEIDISDTVNTYLDRNGTVLWKDTGSDNYRLVVSEDEIPEYMRQATIAIEDRNFYNHIGVDFGALIRAAFSTLDRAMPSGTFHVLHLNTCLPNSSRPTQALNL